MKRIVTIAVLVCLFIGTYGQKGETVIVIETSLGDIELMLYDETPLHKENMIKLIKEDFYRDQLFHRVIKDFMIQGGDPHSVEAPFGQRLGNGGPGYKIPAEIKEGLYHKKGTLAAARMGDKVNPMKESSGSQFYIVVGQVFTNEQLDQMEEIGRGGPYTEEQREIYTTIGGTPHLDGGYTVFGEVIKGIDIVEKISMTKTNSYDRPENDIVYSIKLK